MTLMTLISPHPQHNHFHQAKLNPDMVSFAEKLRPVKINHLQHKDDKPFLHKMEGRYYLSWGCWYAVGNSPYGPFNFSGSVINTTALASTEYQSTALSNQAIAGDDAER